MKPPTLYDHQEEVLKRSWNRKYFALLLEQGCGKTRILLDTARWLWQERKIRAMVVIAPNGVHRNWTEIEIPIHAPKILPENILTWDSRKSKAEDFAANPGKTGLLVRAYNVEGFSRDGAPASLALRKFLKKFPDTLLIIDESTRIKTPTAKRTRVLISLGRLAQYRRIATGMLVAQTPFDVYSQFQFLEKGCLGFPTFSDFKYTYGTFKNDHVTTKKGKMVEFKKLRDYKCLDDLRKRIAPLSSRYTKEQCLDLPPKIRTSVIVTLDPKQRRFFNDMEAEGVIYVPEENIDLMAPVHLVRLIRCQQITSGFIPTENPEGTPWTPIAGIKNPKLQAIGIFWRTMQGRSLFGRFFDQKSK